MEALILSFSHLFLLTGFLFFWKKKDIQDFFKNRQDVYKKESEESHHLLVCAEKNFQMTVEKWNQLTFLCDKMKTEYQEQGSLVYQNLLIDAKKKSNLLYHEAKESIDYFWIEQKDKIYFQFVENIFFRLEKKIFLHLTPEKKEWMENLFFSRLNHLNHKEKKS